MAHWTTTPEEYEHVRKTMLQIALGQRVTITTKDGSTHEGWIVGQYSGTNAGDNLRAGRGPSVTSIHGEIRLQPLTGPVIVISALDIQRVEILRL